MSEEQQAQTWYDLPPFVEDPFEVFVNGVPQHAGVDYERAGRSLVFPRTLKPERALSRFQWARAALGIAGTYDSHDTVDLAYHRDGRRLVAHGLRPREEERG